NCYILSMNQKIYNLLRWSEKYTQTDMVYLIRGGFWLTLEQGITSLAGILLAVAFANLVPKETYGAYRYVLSLVGILSVFTLSGMNTAIARAVARGSEGMLAPAFKTRLAWGIIGGIASLGAAGFYFYRGDITLTFCFLIAAFFLPLMDSLTLYESFWEGKKLFKTRAAYNIFIRVFSVLFLVATLFLTKNLFLILLAYFCSYTLFRFICFWIAIRKAVPCQKQDSETISYGKHLSLMNVMGVLGSQLDKILLWHFLGPVALASYVLAITPVDHIANLFKNIFPLSLPKFSQQSLETIQATLFKKIAKLFLFGACFIGLYVILAPWIYKLFFPIYLEAVPYSQFYTIVTLLMIPQIPLLAVLSAQMKKKELYIVKFTSPALRIALVFILLPLYGIWGAILTIIFTQAINLALLLFFLRKQRQVSNPSLLLS
ncbi:MAG: oligosaccharide flippase family protein, partial [bacterium]|nr:oligosaccharide flippase family protein [bacterium]